MKPVIIIPARYESSRFPGKPLVMIKGKTLLQHVWGQSVKALSPPQVYIATDDERIAAHCREKKMQFVMTPSSCATGTDRLYEAAKQLPADLYINVQGDEPLVRPDDILKVLRTAEKMPDRVVNAMCPIQTEEDFRSPSVPKVVATPEGRLLYMSRAAIPTDKKFSFRAAMKQVCIYAFSKSLLERFGRVKGKSPLEAIEDIEILRFLETGVEVQMVQVSSSSIAVDFPGDIVRVEKALHA
ncbi:MAG: 3-deoxy-manno-octulosonate cytidylyltransferase [Deltaproteobacteria bacterium]|nr:3-deoxy-manno-octulosonate cytidylyltransferase [Deltaproteobacteria bacterium]